MKKEKKLITVTDLGPGDGGKGGTIHKLCAVKEAHTVIKVGGAQGSHGVRTAAGESFNFSQFGCGTFERRATHISRNFVMTPIGVLNEAKELRYVHGITNVFDLMTIDEDSLCATPYHMIASRLREIARKNNPRGTIGTGVGEALQDSEKYPDLAIYTKDLYDKALLLEKLKEIRFHMRMSLGEIIAGVEDLLEADQPYVREQIALLHDEIFMQFIADQFVSLSKQVKIVGGEYLADSILKPDGVTVVESSHGILTDKFYGFTPHTSKLRTVLDRTKSLITQTNYTGDVLNLGVTRAYAIRHGAGPFVTDQPAMVETLLPGSSKEHGRYQGKVRVGPLDMVTLRYAIEVCGGPNVFDGLVVTWFDQIQSNGSWDICNSYQHPTAPDFFSPTGDIVVHRGADQAQLDRQTELTRLLHDCVPNIITHASPSVELCAEAMEASLKIPVRMISLGPTEDDKVCI